MSAPRATLRRSLQQPGFLGLLGATVALGTAYSFVVPFLSLWGTEQVGLTSWQFGGFMTATALSSVLVSTTFARWSDSHLSRRTTLTLGALGGVLGYVGYAVTLDPRVLLGLAVTLIALSTICFPQLFAHVRETFDRPENRTPHSSLLMSIVRVCFSVAWTAGPAAAAWVMLHHGFRGMFLAAAGLYATFLCGVLLCVPARAPVPHEHVKLPVWRVLARGDILAAFVAFAAVLAAHAMNMMNLPLMITRILGGTERHVGIAFGIGPVVEIPLMLWFGHLASRGHQQLLIRIGAAATVLYFAALACATATWQIYPIQILSGVSFAILTNVAILFFQDLLPGQTGLGTAIFSNSGNVGNLVGYFSFGVLAGWVGHRGIFVVCAGLTVITLVILLVFRPRQSPASISHAT